MSACFRKAFCGCAGLVLLHSAIFAAAQLANAPVAGATSGNVRTPALGAGNNFMQSQFAGAEFMFHDVFEEQYKR